MKGQTEINGEYLIFWAVRAGIKNNTVSDLFVNIFSSAGGKVFYLYKVVVKSS